MRFCLAVVLALLPLTFVFGQQQQSFMEVKGADGDVEPFDFEFSTSGYKYVLSSNGRGRREGQQPARTFNLRLHRDDHLTRALYHAEFQGDLLLICEYSDVEYGAGFITRLDGQTLRTKWKRSIPAFNIGPGLIDGRFAYVTAIGFIGKVNLETGAYAWKHASLYRTSRPKASAYADADFNSFELPEVEGNFVIFKEVETYANVLSPKILKVDKRSGRIVRLTTVTSN
ncbi:MAG TPA: hypothetical protein VJS17_00275 [Pyrinomonadaceae bacterium]|nr:hypothetical protein [Pyrinomonadaceae bacterium]